MVSPSVGGRTGPVDDRMRAPDVILSDPAEQVAGDLAVMQGDGARDAIAPPCLLHPDAGVAVREQRLGRAMPGMAIRQQRCGAADVLVGEGGDHPGSVLGPSSVSQRSGSRGRSKQSGRSYTNPGTPALRPRPGRVRPRAPGTPSPGAGSRGAPRTTPPRRRPRPASRRARHLGLPEHQGQPLGHAGGPQAGELVELARRCPRATARDGRRRRAAAGRRSAPPPEPAERRDARSRPPAPMPPWRAAAPRRPPARARTRSPREGTARRP